MSELGYQIGRKLIEWDVDFNDWRDMRRKNRKDRRQRWHDLSEKVQAAQQAVDDARNPITEVVALGKEGQKNKCFTDRKFPVWVNTDGNNDGEPIQLCYDVVPWTQCNYVGPDGFCTKDCHDGEKECPNKAKNTDYGQKRKALDAAIAARRDFVWELFAINGVRIDKFWLLTWDIWKKRYQIRRIDNPRLNGSDIEARQEYQERQKITIPMETACKEMRKQRRAMLRQMFGINDKVKK